MTMDTGEKQSMAAETKRITVDEDMRPLFEEATTHALIVEIGDQAYRINAERICPILLTQSIVSMVPYRLSMVDLDQRYQMKKLKT